MAIHISDPETVRLVRDYAKSQKVGITQAVKLAVLTATISEKDGVDAFTARIEPILAEIRAARAKTQNVSG